MAIQNAINLTATGIISADGAGVYSGRTLTQPAAGITISNADGTAGNPTFALADDLAAVEGLSGTGVVTRTAANTWATNTISTHAIVTGAAGNAVTDTGPLTNGQLIIGDTGNAPAAATLTAGTGITISNGAGSITIDADNNGDVVGPGSATDNAIVRFDGTTGKLIQNSAVTITDTTGQITDDNANAGANTEHRFSNTSNTAGSGINIRLACGGGSAGDTWFRWAVEGVREYSMGIDNDDSDALCITGASTLNGTNRWRMSANGERTMPFQPAFLATNSTSDTNQTGAGTTVTVEFDSEVFDQNGDYNNTTDTFTAPVTGKYHFNVQVAVNSLSSAMTQCLITLVTTSRTFWISNLNPYAVRNASSGTHIMGGSVEATMTAADTAFVQIVISGGAGDTATIQGGNTATSFSGALIC